MNKIYRYYQQECDDAIYKELQSADKCIVKMFCGSGKSLVMIKCKVTKNKPLVVYVFPSLALIEQFYNDYLVDFSDITLKVSSEVGATTDYIIIRKFLEQKENKIICVTYQSFDVLLNSLGEHKINICIFDEAHHAVGELYQTLIFGNTACEKQIFFTATPKNANGIVMYDLENNKAGDCGDLAYVYSYYKGVQEGYLNPFEIRIDMYGENTNYSIYESIVRSIVVSGNNRVLTFHSDVNTEKNTTVNKFVDLEEFKKAYKKVIETEFPDKKKFYKRFNFKALDSSVKPVARKKILDDFDKTSDTDIYIISSCETIGEGVDSKNANMVVFVDPKTSYVKIIQNIGRVVRKQFGVNKPPSTILLPCWVDKTKYLECNGDREKCDEVIRKDMNKTGNFSIIMNVMAALKQEDPDLYELCVNYGNSYSPREIKDNLKKHGYKVVETEENIGLLETLGNVLDNEIDEEIYEDMPDDVIINAIADENGVCVEVHNDSLEKPVKQYCDHNKDIVRILERKESNDDSDEEVSYNMIVKDDGTKRNQDVIGGISRNRCRLDVNISSEIHVLWNIANGFDITKDICNCVIDCNVEDRWFIRYDEADKYGDKYDVRPSKHDNVNSYAKSLGIWIGNQNQKYVKGLLSEDKVILWKQLVEKHKFLLNPNDKWINDYKTVTNYGLVNKTRPSQHDKNPEVQKMGQWILDVNKMYRKNVGVMKVEEHRRLWDEFNKLEFMKDSDALWMDKHDELNKYAETFGKKPSSRDKNPVIKTLGYWLGTQFRNLNDNVKTMKDLKKREMFANLITRYPFLKMKDFNEVWYDNYYALCKYINIHGCKPSRRDKNKDVANLGGWVAKQSDNLIKGVEAMRQADKIKLWKVLEATNFTSAPVYDNQLINMSQSNLEISNENTNVATIPAPKLNVVKPITTSKKSMKLTRTVTKEFSDEEIAKERRDKIHSELSSLHKKYKTMNSKNLHEEFKDDQRIWFEYHRIAEDNEKSFPEDEIPRNRIIKELDAIKTNRNKIVVDMGCGKTDISQSFKDDKRFQFINMDHIACNETVIARDISNTELKSDSIDIAILSLAMWGSNCKDYIKEAYRILESGGWLYIIEPTKRWSDKEGMYSIIEGTEAIHLKNLLKDNNFQISYEKIDKFCMFRCIKI